jgi:peptidoglycan/xylan/chitin deacetylase (PgdA/CDA1 family)
MNKHSLFIAIFWAIITTSICISSCSKDPIQLPENKQVELKSTGTVYLCFDDGPCGNTSTLVSKLKNAGVTATFFIWGNRISNNTYAFSLIKNAGYSIQNHSFTHSHMTGWTQAQVQNDLSLCNAAITAQGCAKPTKVRLPYLETNANINAACAALGLKIVSPTVYSNDWNGASTAQIISSVSGLTNGGNALMHDGYANTNNAIAQIVTNLKNKGYAFGKY